MLLIFNQPFGFNAILGLIGLAGILIHNTLILTEQIKENERPVWMTTMPSSKRPCRGRDPLF
jgi:multidrug efflux pump subunit AcrB